MTLSNAFSWIKNFWISNKTSLKYVPSGRIDELSALIQIMAWHQTGNKPLSDPMMTQFTDAYMHHLASMCWVMSLQFIWRSSTHRWNLWVSDIQMGCRDLTTWQGTRIVVLVMGARQHAPFYYQIISLAPGKFEWNFRYVIFKQISVIDGWGISCEIALIWMSLDFTDDQSTLVQVRAWCRQATSHYLSQCWPRSLMPFDVNRAQWVIYINPWNAELFRGNKKKLQFLSFVDVEMTKVVAILPHGSQGWVHLT